MTIWLGILRYSPSVFVQHAENISPMQSKNNLFSWHQITSVVVFVPISVWRTVRATISMKAGPSRWRWMAVFLCGHPWKVNPCLVLHDEEAHTVAPEVTVDLKDCYKAEELGQQLNFSRPDRGMSWLKRWYFIGNFIYLECLEPVCGPVFFSWKLVGVKQQIRFVCVRLVETSEAKCWMTKVQQGLENEYNWSQSSKAIVGKELFFFKASLSVMCQCCLLD